MLVFPLPVDTNYTAESMSLLHLIGQLLRGRSSDCYHFGTTLIHRSVAAVDNALGFLVGVIIYYLQYTACQTSLEFRKLIDLSNNLSFTMKHSLITICLLLLQNDSSKAKAKIKQV